jgi:hypothetical protein
MADLELLDDDGVLLCNLAALCQAADAKEIADHAIILFDCNPCQSHRLVTLGLQPIKLGTVIEFAVV